ncbi:MAG: universal stress protein [Gemmatales bacterium]|nr:universal stress protein [Gemmatales bacterium]MDW7994129.1 universal stress protein [Gemmatales bacterium]
MQNLRTILHPTDFSEPAKAAWQTACALARFYGARLVALHVVFPLTAAYTEVIPTEAIEQQIASGRQALEQLEPTEAGLAVEKRLETGDPVEMILRVAGELPADLIVMGSHGRTGLARLLMGSVAEQVVRKAPCPVLVVKRPIS